jgi:uncharacterized membrane protein YfcA
MFDYALIVVVAFGASLLTLYSGFGLGTLLLPAFALFAPLPVAIAATAVVHLANNLFKGALLARAANASVLLHFLPTAVIGAFAGAWILGHLADLEPWSRYSIGTREFLIAPVKCVIGLVILAFVLIEGHPRIKHLELSVRWMPVGGLLSGFFGGLSGHQGALRSMFLVKCGLDTTAFVATGVLIAIAIDLTRLTWYGGGGMVLLAEAPPGLLKLIGVACAAAFAGAWLGTKWLKKAKMPLVQRIVAVGLVLVGLGLIGGIL